MSDETMERDVIKKKIQIEARVPLEKAELDQLTVAIGEAVEAVEVAKIAEKARSSEAKRAIKAKEILIKKLSHDVREQSREGMVDAEELWDYDTWSVKTVRLDTKEEVTIRPMSAEERTAHKQPELPMDLDLPPQATNGIVQTDANKPSGKARKRNGAAKEAI